MAIAPTIVGAIIGASSDDSSHGYFWASAFWVGICVVSICMNIWLYIDDIKNHGGWLNKVHKGDAISDLIQTPAPDKVRRTLPGAENDPNTVTLAYQVSGTAREALKRSMLRKSMAK